MASYNLDYLTDAGQKYALAALIKCKSVGEPFITYGRIAEILEDKLGVEKIFSIHPGQVVGAMMDAILEYDEEAPLINALVTRSDGIPRKGVSGYVERKYKKKTQGGWLGLSKTEKLELIEIIRKDVRQYSNWENIYETLYGDDLSETTPEIVSTEEDGDPGSSGHFGGGGESDDHKRLKDWVANNPRKIGIPTDYGIGEPEYPLPSGDRVDVMFTDGANFIPVEVKSWRSSEDDLRRGIYQCVKYREVTKAKELPVEILANPILVIETELSKTLRDRAKLLKVKYEQVRINNKNK